MDLALKKTYKDWYGFFGFLFDGITTFLGYLMRIPSL